MDRIELTNVKKALMKYGVYITELMKQKLQQDGKVATGNLINEIKPYTETEEDKEFLYVDIPRYGVYVDRGRKPNSKMPPVKKIREWVSIKGIRPINNMSLDQTAFLIARSIGIRGIKASPFIDIFFNNVDELNDLIEESAVEDMENVINEYIKEFNKNNSITI